MSTATLSHWSDTPASAPARTGLALAVTVAVFYALCTAAWLVAPGPFLGFMSSLFHGMDFAPMVQPSGFTWSGFLVAMAVLSAWAFLAGAFFAWLRELLAR